MAQDSSAFDPKLAALFASSSGPVTAPPKPVKTYNPSKKTSTVKKKAQKPDRTSLDSSDNPDSSGIDEDSNESSSASESEVEAEEQIERPRKRRKTDQDEDLESRYLNRLAREEELDQKTRERQEVTSTQADGQNDDQDSNSGSDLNSGLEDLSDSDAENDATGDDDNEAIPKHESLTSSKLDVEADKINRTVFLGNVSNTVIKSKTAKKALILHLRTGLDTKHHEKIESIRFRSTAFVSDAGPKRAAYAKKELMDETMKSTNAYVVVSSEAAARKLAARLNGSTVLDRHLRVDNLGAPARVDHRRCIFVGNLTFVDEATTTEETEDGASKKRKRAKESADVEEGLWRTFSKAGHVESVRVVRDKETRISKGFAYVQFTGENAVEAALLMDGKKYPPMLPRVLRVMRAKRDMKSKRRDAHQPKDERRRTDKRFPRDNRSAPARSQQNTNTNKNHVFEGHRASSSSTPKGLKKLKQRPTTKPDNRSSKRAAAFRAGGGKKKRDLPS